MGLDCGSDGVLRAAGAASSYNRVDTSRAGRGP